MYLYELWELVDLLEKSDSCLWKRDNKIRLQLVVTRIIQFSLSTRLVRVIVPDGGICVSVKREQKTDSIRKKITDVLN